MGRIFRLSMLKMTIFQKLLIGIIAMLMLIATISFISIVSINELENTSKFMLEESREQNIFQRLKLSVQQLVMPPNDYLIHGNKVEILHFKQLLSIVRTQIDECREIIGHPLEQKGLDEFENSLIAVESLAVGIFNLENPIGNSEGAIKMEEMDAITNDAIINLDKLLSISSLEMSEYINTNQKTSIRATKINIFIGLFIAICLVVGGFFYVKEITRPIKNLSQTAQKISLGDLSAKANVNIGVHDEIDDFAKSFNNMIGILAKTTVSRDYFNNILNRMVDTLIITDTTGKITLVNQATIDLLEYTEEEIIGQSIEKILFRNSGNEVLNNFDIASKLNEESVQNVYNTYYSKSNKAIPVSFSRSFMYDSNNKKMGILCIAFHKTEGDQEEQPSEDNSENDQRNIKTVGEIPLTSRELEITKLIIEELSNREIADELFISVRTVETHRKNIMQKLHAKSVIALVHYAAQNGII